MNLPSSVPNAPSLISFIFPGLILFSSFLLYEADWLERLGLILTIVIIASGWTSYGLVGETTYNDVLFIGDVGLIASYVVLIRTSAELNYSLSSIQALFAISSAIFFFYSVWGWGALAFIHGKSASSRRHFLTFVVLNLAISATFLLVSVPYLGRFVPIPALIVLYFATWLGVLILWHFGRIRSAVKEVYSGARKSQ